MICKAFFFFLKCALYYSGCALGQQNKHYLCVWVCARTSLYVCSEGILLRPRLQLAEISGIRPAAAATASAAISLPDPLRLTRPAPLTRTFHFYALIKPIKRNCNCTIRCQFEKDQGLAFRIYIFAILDFFSNLFKHIFRLVLWRWKWIALPK